MLQYILTIKHHVMKHTIMASSVLILALFCISCKKHCDEPETTTCRPYQTRLADSTLDAIFYFNDWGAPSQIKREERNTGEWEYIFYYDQDKRLVQLIEGYFSNYDTAVSGLFKYYYEGDLIKYDTIYETGEDIPPPGYLASGIYTYDHHDRIIQYIRKDANSNHSDTLTYSYPEEDPFINNKSILVGNKELMFVNKDYSKNNPTAIKFNALGYPTQFAEWENGQHTEGYRFLSLRIAYLNYDCTRSNHVKGISSN